MSIIKRNPYETRVVITGMGTINPIAYSVEEYWENLAKGKPGVRLAKHTELGDFAVQVGGEVDYPENLQDYFPRKMIKRMGRYIIFGHYAATDALKHSGIQPEEIEKAPYRYGAIIGTGDGGLEIQYDASVRLEEQGLEAISPFFVVSHIPNTPPGYFAKENNLQGPNFSVNSACASSNHAIGSAAMQIKMGYADVIFAGGTEGVVSEQAFAGFNVIYALSRRNDDPQSASRPFDKNRDGFVLAEGSGIICLEELEHAKKRGASIYGELKGFGMTCDAYDLVAPHPEGRGQIGAINMAFEDAEINKEDIDLINAHGTSTPLGDLTESRSIRSVFGDLTDNIPVHSTKSMLGHMIGAAGGTEIIAALMAINKGVIHPSINVFDQDPEINLNIAKEPIEKEVKNVLSNSFGFGGQNSTIIVSKFVD